MISRKKYNNLEGSDLLKDAAKSVGMNFAAGFTANNPVFSLVNFGVQRVIEKQEADKAKSKAREKAYAEIERARQRREAVLKAVEDSIQGSREEAQSILNNEKLKNQQSLLKLQSGLNYVMALSLGYVAFRVLKKGVVHAFS